MSLVSSSTSSLYDTTPGGFMTRFYKPIAISPAVSACLARINNLINQRVPGATVEIVGEGPEGRIDLIARYQGVALGRSFMLSSECESAYEANPETCDAIDPVAACWVTVLSYRAKEIQKFRRNVATA